MKKPSLRSFTRNSLETTRPRIQALLVAAVVSVPTLASAEDPKKTVEFDFAGAIAERAAKALDDPKTDGSSANRETPPQIAFKFDEVISAPKTASCENTPNSTSVTLADGSTVDCEVLPREVAEPADAETASETISPEAIAAIADIKQQLESAARSKNVKTITDAIALTDAYYWAEERTQAERDYWEASGNRIAFNAAEKTLNGLAPNAIAALTDAGSDQPALETAISDAQTLLTALGDPSQLNQAIKKAKRELEKIKAEADARARRAKLRQHQERIAAMIAEGNRAAEAQASNQKRATQRSSHTQSQPSTSAMSEFTTENEDSFPAEMVNLVATIIHEASQLDRYNGPEALQASLRAAAKKLKQDLPEEILSGSWNDFSRSRQFSQIQIPEVQMLILPGASMNNLFFQLDNLITGSFNFASNHPGLDQPIEDTLNAVLAISSTTESALPDTHDSNTKDTTTLDAVTVASASDQDQAPAAIAGYFDTAGNWQPGEAPEVTVAVAPPITEEPPAIVQPDPTGAEAAAVISDDQAVTEKEATSRPLDFSQMIGDAPRLAPVPRTKPTRSTEGEVVTEEAPPAMDAVSETSETVFKSNYFEPADRNQISETLGFNIGDTFIPDQGLAIRGLINGKDKRAYTKAGGIYPSEGIVIKDVVNYIDSSRVGIVFVGPEGVDYVINASSANGRKAYGQTIQSQTEQVQVAEIPVIEAPKEPVKARPTGYETAQQVIPGATPEIAPEPQILAESQAAPAQEECKVEQSDDPISFEYNGMTIDVPQGVEHLVEADLDCVEKALVTVDPETGQFFSVIDLFTTDEDTASVAEQIATMARADIPSHVALELTMDPDGKVIAKKVFETSGQAGVPGAPSADTTIQGQ